MSYPRVHIKKSYAFTFKGGPGGHVSLTNDGRAVLVHLRHTDGKLESKVFTTNSDETAEAQARRYVLEKIDPEAKFFEDPFLDLTNWLLMNT